MASDSFSIDVFPTLTRALIQQSKYSLKRVQAYDDSGKELVVVGDRQIHFDNKTNDWSMEKDGLYLSLEFEIKNAGLLFGERGVAGAGTIMGVAAVLKSPVSCRRDTFSSDVMISEIDGTVEGRVVVLMNNHEYRGSATIDLALYVREGGGVPGYADDRGFVLGVFQSISISLNGEGSIFPIDTISSDKGFLWRLECDYSDPLVDRFDESIALVINDKHPLYKTLEIDKINIQNPMFLSVLSNAIQVLIERVGPEMTSEQIQNGSGISEGSVAAAVRYFIINFAHSYDDPVELAFEVQQYLFPVINDGN